MNGLYRASGRLAGWLLLGLLAGAGAARPETPAGPEAETPRTIDRADPEFWSATERRVADLPAEIYRQAAHRLLRRVRLADGRQALYLLQKALNLSPGDPQLLADFALASLAPYRWTWDRDEVWIDRAYKSLNRARERAPDLLEVHRAGGLLIMLHGRLQEAEEELRRALAIDPGDLETLLILGANLRVQQRFREAYEVYDRAIAVDPVDWRGYAGIGDVYRDDHWYEEALNLYRKAGELNDRAFAPRFGQVTVYQRTGFPNIANRLQVEVLRDFKEFSGLVLLSAAAVHMQTRQYGKALEELEQISLGGSRGLCQGTVIYRTGLCHLHRGEADRAAAAFRHVIDDYPEARDGSDYGPRALFPASLHLAEILDERGRPEEANAVLDDVSRDAEAPLVLHLRLAERYGSYRLFDRAAEVLRRGLAAETPADLLGERVRLRVDLARALRGGGDAGGAAAGLDAIAPEARAAGTPADVYQMARGFALVGRLAEAGDWLALAIDRGYAHFGAIRTEPDLESLRATPRYRDLLRGK